MNTIRSIPELLAPAGTLDAARAALANGANAIYLGAERFNARDDGAQLTLDELGEACRLAHARGARVYLTFNVLIKPGELVEALEHLGECLDRGIDAVIVQDLGAIRLIRTIYPDLEIHASTQVTVHDTSGAAVLHSLGAQRIVLARENTLDDIRAIHAALPEVGLESFVHGALCISYSGQCFMSGMISERSANRGSCAQSCRKDYVLTDTATGAELDRGYLISAKDLGAWDHLADIADAGIGCLKIEGRKKKPEYVATVTQGYRGFLDRLAQGEWRDPSPAEVKPLVQIFSRGFTGGMYGGRDGREYITRSQPDNRGAELGKVLRSEGRELIIAVSEAVTVGDGLGFEHPEGPSKGNLGYSVTRARVVGTEAGRQVMAVNREMEIPAGWTVVRSSQAALLERAKQSYAEVPRSLGESKVPVDLAVTGQVGTPLAVDWQWDGNVFRTESTEPLQAARQHGLDSARLREQLGRLGDTPFVLRSLDLSGLEGQLFISVSTLNDLRQQASRLMIEQVEAAREVARLTRHQTIVEVVATPGLSSEPGRSTDVAPTPRLVVEVFSVDQALEAAAAGADEISLDPFLRHPSPTPNKVRTLFAELAGQGKTARLRLPTIVRPEHRAGLDRWLALESPVSTGHLGIAAELAAAGRDVVADYSVNCFNQHTAGAIFDLGVRRIVLSIELTGDEMTQVIAPWGGAPFDVVVYGRPEGMTLEHCVLSAAFDREVTTCRDLCVQKHPEVTLTDPAGYSFPVATDSACRNRLLHSRPIDGSDYLPSLWASGLQSYRLLFNVPGDPVREVTEAYRTLIDSLGEGQSPDARAIRGLRGRQYTKGHFARAV